jgi:hypothetical protein
MKFSNVTKTIFVSNQKENTKKSSLEKKTPEVEMWETYIF